MQNKELLEATKPQKPLIDERPNQPKENQKILTDNKTNK